MLVLDGHKSHISVDFENFCKEHNIIPICLPPHSSHLTQPLDVGFFGLLKKAYGKEIGKFIQAHVNHITKVEFFLPFYAAYNATITKENVASGFRGAGLIPSNPQAVISKLNIKLQTPTLTGPPDTSTDSWVSQIPHNPTEAILQSTLVKTQISGHQGSSPTPIFSAVKQMVKGIEVLAHSVTLLSTENHTLQKANEALSKRRRVKKTRVRQGGILLVEDAQDILAQRDAREQAAQDRHKSRDGNRERLVTVQRCGNCTEPGHNARTCQISKSS
jgi:hypothetical protein